MIMEQSTEEAITAVLSHLEREHERDGDGGRDLAADLVRWIRSLSAPEALAVRSYLIDRIRHEESLPGRGDSWGVWLFALADIDRDIPTMAALEQLALKTPDKTTEWRETIVKAIKR